MDSTNWWQGYIVTYPSTDFLQKSKPKSQLKEKKKKKSLKIAPKNTEKEKYQIWGRRTNIARIWTLDYFMMCDHKSFLSRSIFYIAKLSMFFIVDPTDSVPSRLCFTSMKASRCHHVSVGPPFQVLRPKLVKPAADGFEAQTTKLSIPGFED